MSGTKISALPAGISRRRCGSTVEHVSTRWFRHQVSSDCSGKLKAERVHRVGVEIGRVVAETIGVMIVEVGMTNVAMTATNAQTAAVAAEILGTSVVPAVIAMMIENDRVMPRAEMREGVGTTGRQTEGASVGTPTRIAAPARRQYIGRRGPPPEASPSNSRSPSTLR